MVKIMLKKPMTAIPLRALSAFKPAVSSIEVP